MNLVALLIAPLVVDYAADEPVRAAIAIGGGLVLAGAIWHSKRQKAEALVGPG
jgi:hypothetical protein